MERTDIITQRTDTHVNTQDTLDIRNAQSSARAAIMSNDADALSALSSFGVELFAITSPVPRIASVYDRCVCAIVAGSKTAYIGETTHPYDASRYLCSLRTLPIESEVVEATPENPVVGLSIELTSPPVTQFVLEYMSVHGIENDAQVDAADGPLYLVEWSARFADSVARLVELCDDPVRARLLGPGRIREVLLEVLDGPAGHALCTSIGRDSLTPVFEHIREHLGEPIAIDELASLAGMSRATFDRKFREATTTSALQFIKALRLNRAAMLISHGSTTSSAADQVGYSSAAQFSRDFRSHFGMSPRDWKKTPHFAF